MERFFVSLWLGVLSVATLPYGIYGYASQELIGERAPNFTLEDINGKTVSLSSYHGKIVVLDFWAVWCGPCEQSVPYFQTLADKYRKDGLEVVGLHVDDRRPSASKIEEYLGNRGVSYINLLSTVEVDDQYMIYAMPTTYMIDRNGVLRGRHIGFNPTRTPERIESDLQKMLD